MSQNDPVQIAPICANRTSAGNVLIPARWEIENHTRAISLYFVWYSMGYTNGFTLARTWDHLGFKEQRPHYSTWARSLLGILGSERNCSLLLTCNDRKGRGSRAAAHNKSRICQLHSWGCSH